MRSWRMRALEDTTDAHVETEQQIQAAMGLLPSRRKPPRLPRQRRNTSEIRGQLA